MEPTFRIAAEADADLLLAVMREYYVYDGHAYDEARARIALLTFLQEPSFGRAWLVGDQHTPVGYIVLTLGYSLEYLGRDAFVDEFYLRLSHRGRGLGAQESGVRGSPGTGQRFAIDSPGGGPPKTVWPKRSTAGPATPITITVSCRSGSNAALPSPGLALFDPLPLVCRLLCWL